MDITNAYFSFIGGNQLAGDKTPLCMRRYITGKMAKNLAFNAAHFGEGMFLDRMFYKL
jgi:hypothetical protein